MKKNRLGLKTLLLLVTILISMCGIIHAQPPPIPSDYSGYVTVNGELAPDGAIVYAKIENYTSESVSVANGGRYKFLIIEADSSYIDKTVRFYVDPDGNGPLTAVMADETSTFKQGESHEINLTIVIPVDDTPPVIVNVSPSKVTTSGATITWITDEPSTSQVEYGVTISYGSLTALDSTLKTSHSVGLTGLAEGTTYHFRVLSTDEAGNPAHSDDQTFKTKTSTAPPAPYFPPVITNKPPVADAGPDRTVYVDVAIHLNGADSQDPDGTIEVYHWFLGDGSYESGVKVIHAYEEAGVYTASLSVTDNNGATSTDDCTVTVLPSPAPLEASIFDAIPANSTGHVVDASSWTDTTVEVNTTDTVTVTIIRYETNPHPGDPMPEGGVPKYVDVFISDPDAVDWPIYIEMSYTDDEIAGLDEASLGMYYWMDGAWHRCSDTGVDTERNVVWAYMTAEEASGSPIFMGGMVAIPIPAEFQFSQLTIEPEEVEPGAEVTISIMVTNIGEATGNRTVSLDVGEGLFTSVKTVTLEGGESETLVFTVIPETEGTYSVEVEGLVSSFEARIPLRPAEFVVSDLSITPEEAELAEGADAFPFEVTVDVTNVGEQEGSHTVLLKVDDSINEFIASETVTLGGGEETSILFDVMAGVGSHAVEVDGLTGGFVVKPYLIPPRPAEFVVSELEAEPAEVEEGEATAFSVKVTNIGETEGSHTVEFEVDGEMIGTETVTLAGGESATISLEGTWSAGTHQVSVGDLTETFIVSKRVKPFWTRPGSVAGILIVIVSAGAIIYILRRPQGATTKLVAE